MISYRKNHKMTFVFAAVIMMTIIMTYQILNANDAFARGRGGAGGGHTNGIGSIFSIHHNLNSFSIDGPNGHGFSIGNKGLHLH